MKQIRTTIESPYEPNDNSALWLDTSNPDAPILKAFTNGKWQATIGGEKVTEISGDSTDEEIPTAKAVNDRVTELADAVGVDLDKYKEYFTIEATVDDTTVYFRQSGYAVTDGLAPLKVDVSIDNGETWTEVTAAPAEDDVPGAVLVTLDAGDKALIRGNNSAYGYYSPEESMDDSIENCNFWADSPCYVYGNIMSLVSKERFETLHSVNEYAFAYFFSNYAGGLDWSWVLNKTGNELLLPATTLAEWCYVYMFGNCTALTTAPILPATTLTLGCYFAMFSSCSSLTTAPTLPATSLADRCYHSMFWGCTSLTSAPTLPASTLEDQCYSHMFDTCTNLVSAPELPATILTQACYHAMFLDCTSLTSAPELPATTLVDNCYMSMFSGCANLSYIKALFTTTPGNNYTQGWVHGVKSIGTFVKSTNATWNVSGGHGVPSGWTVKQQSPAQRSDQADWEETNVNRASYIWHKPIIDVTEFHSGDEISGAEASDFNDVLAVKVHDSLFPRMSFRDASILSKDNNSIFSSMINQADQMSNPEIENIFGTMSVDEEGFVTVWSAFAVVHGNEGYKLFFSEY